MATFKINDLAAVFVNQLTEGSCPTEKNRYPDAERAADALELAGLRRDVEPWRQEKRCYPCPLCGGFHLTSQGLWRAAQVRWPRTPERATKCKLVPEGVPSGTFAQLP